MKQKLTIILLFGLTLSLGFLPNALAEIQVDPINHDFGTLAVGESQTVVINVQNIEGATPTVLTIYGASLLTGDPDFQVDSSYLLPQMRPGESTIIKVEFIPSSSGSFSGQMVIYSDDRASPEVVVTFQGEGVFEGTGGVENPITIEEVLSFFDTSVDEKDLVGNFPVHSKLVASIKKISKGKKISKRLKRIKIKLSEMRLNALRNMLLSAAEFIEAGDVEAACEQLNAAYMKCDGEFRPPDFVVGPAAPDLADMIVELMEELGCQ